MKEFDKTILVTGGAGFMGSHFVRHMAKKYPGYRLVVVDKLTYAGSKENIADALGEQVQFLQTDICDRDSMRNVFSEARPDYIAHYAAESHVDNSIADSDAFVRSNVLGTQVLLDFAREFKVGRYIQVSTDEVFGEIEDGAFLETDPFAPRSPYSASKAGADHLCHAAYTTHGVPVIVTHSCNNYGSYQYPEKLIPRSICLLLSGGNVKLMGKGENVREWIAAQDHAGAIDFLLHRGQVGEVYNIGTGEERTNKEIVDALLKNLGMGSDRVMKISHRAGHDFRYAVNSDKLRALGWKPKISFEDGLSATVEWYKAHEKWWKPRFELSEKRYADVGEGVF